MPAPKTTTPPKTLESKLARLGLRTDMDLVLHLPLRYEDETQIITIRDACMRGGQTWQVEGIVTKNEISFKPRRQLLVTIADASGDLLLRFMNFYGSQVKQLAEGTRVRARAEVDWADTVPPAIRKRMDLMDFEPAVKLLHYPPADVDEHALIERSHPAWDRMKFDELLAQQLSLKRAQRARREKGAPPLRAVGQLSEGFLAGLPFALTGAQQRVVEEIRADLRAGYPMQRLLQGDVGSGKTVVSALAAAQAIDSGYQAALMAPTEILAEQHFRKI
ncbi:MAG: DEAD/DEAH box helicase, partial [Oxalobacteraceae bacterium]